MKFMRSFLVTSLAAVLCMTASMLMAQDNGGGNGGGRTGGGGGGGGGGFGNFDPAQIQQRRMDNIHEQMGVTDDAEWKALEPRITKVMDAQRELFSLGGRGFGGFGGGRRNGGGGGDNGGGGGGGRRGGFFGPPAPEAESLRNAIENNAPTEQIKAALEKFRAARKAKQAALESAQADLQKLLSVKQEAVAVENGLLN